MTCSILGVDSAPRTGRIIIGAIVTTRKRTCDLCVLLGDSSDMCTCHVLFFTPLLARSPHPRGRGESTLGAQHSKGLSWDVGLGINIL